ncbi:MerR family transcriptional regulator [Actinocorallia sp. API 0066]|uniref:MerR family transcriptional regulator n=1 Tax=Actinocorallia sp. API 0066 TaxID=2896846 RepID=UPI001E54AB0B|nr:MerR family transcriptional regulator [Actinocorallia sp. API 0066]MCD0452099.1 MerR family transcriptional regulator [Actinocorallia sp. API 0066]
MHDDLLTIGRFARLCRLSVKRLRHYDDLGLLPPDLVDAATGYRYYAPARVRDALTVALLRDLDVPLPVIAELLAAPPEARTGLLAAERDRLAARIARDTERLAVLDRLAADPSPAYAVTLTAAPALRLAVVQGSCAAAELGAATRARVTELMAALAGRPWTPPVYGLYPLDLTDGMTVAVGAAVGGEVPGTRPVELPATAVATTLHSGAYAELPLAYTALFSWIHERGHVARGPAREEYLVTPGEAAPHDLLTRLSVPVGGSGPDDEEKP